MRTWIAENFASVVLLLVVILIVFFLVRGMIKHGKQGSCGCGCSNCCGCSGCAAHKKGGNL